MPERTSYANGVPSWVDVASADVDKSIAFYGGLFGWVHAPAGSEEEAGGYGMFMIDEKDVAGIGPLMSPDQPPVWSMYIAVDDADATIAAATAAGGQVAVPAMDVMDAGRMAFVVDPDGAFFGIWQAASHTGAQLVNEPGTFGWSELQCRDMGAAIPFYESVFGYETEITPGGFGEYTVLKIGGRAVGGAVQIDEQWPEGVPSHWHVYFVVDDVEAAAARVLELGGAHHIGPFDAPGVGRISVVSDSNGTHFSIIALANEPD